MPPSEKSQRLYRQLMRLKPITTSASVRACRGIQSQFGKLCSRAERGKTKGSVVRFRRFRAYMALPRRQPAPRDRAILYLHGGGFTAGGLAYARGFGSLLCAETGLPALCIAYRLAPENPYPAALDDALTAYQHLLRLGYPPGKIVLAGESAGGGLVFSLCLRLRAESMDMPGGIVAVSPWSDLTFSGESHVRNAAADPTLTTEGLRRYAADYAAGKARDPLVSPALWDLDGFPPALILVGSDEILLDDSRMLAEKLSIAGVPCRLLVEEGLWHVYALYPIPEAERAMREIRAFIEELP